ncbi:PPOX class F420-dependent oxidoreductase [Streptomyces sp. NPDC048644]|uniref:PPOX class F420-dependent oxidoreductase n=1 Tax=Streptomyces sp. NPDC048644 TaxID=3365582 RepID=UPI00371139CF
MIPDALARSHYVSLVTHRKSGAPVPTPVWAVADGDELLVWTRDDSGKVRRLRNDTRVTVTPCDVRGNIAAGATTSGGTARLLEGPAELARVRRALAAKYGLRFRLLDTGGALLRRGRRPHVGIAVTLER